MQGDFKKGDKLTVKLDAFTEDTLGTSCTVIFCYNGGEKTAINKEIKVAEWNRAIEYEYVLKKIQLSLKCRLESRTMKTCGTETLNKISVLIMYQ